MAPQLTRRGWLRRLLPVAVFVLVLTVAIAGSLAWQWWARHRTVAPLTPLGEQCGEVPASASRVTFRGSDGTTIGAAAVGPRDAGTAVVLRHGASQTICDWLPWAAELSHDTGARVLLFDRRGRGSAPARPGLVQEPDDLARAASLLTDDGAQRLVLVASSMGNSVQTAALPLLPRPPCAVVAISPVLSAADDSGRLAPDPASVTADAWPADLWVTWEEHNGGVAAQAQSLLAAAESAGRATHRLPVDTEDHSRQLVSRHPEVAEFVADAVSACG